MKIKGANVYVDFEPNELAYPVMVEMWDKAKYGRGKRAYHAQFSAEDRARISRLHTKFYDWYLRSGPPETARMTAETLALAREAINFFGSL